MWSGQRAIAAVKRTTINANSDTGCDVYAALHSSDSQQNVRAPHHSEKKKIKTKNNKNSLWTYLHTNRQGYFRIKNI